MCARGTADADGSGAGWRKKGDALVLGDDVGPLLAPRCEPLPPFFFRY
jgi:hypothetical protein